MVLSTLLQNRVVLPIHSRTAWPPIYFRTSWSSSFPLRTEWSSPFPSEPSGPPYSPSKPRGPLFPMVAVPGFKSQSPSSFAAPFLTPPTISYTCQNPRILPALLGCHSKSGQVWPMVWSQSSPSSHAGPVTRGSCFPVPSWVEFAPIPLAQSMGTGI